jgi:tetratricopeptide (TPR) repeat protein
VTHAVRAPFAASLAIILALLAVPAEAGLTEGARLAAVYETILHARFDQVDRQLAETCPPAPVEACRALRAVAVWWRILLNPTSRSLDGHFNELAAAAIAASEAWTKRSPQTAEAWFYLAGSYAPLVQWRVLRGERLSAAREANRIREALERALRLDPTLHDAYFGIGLYHYYADVVPATVKFVRWLMFLPGGDRVKGLQEMLQAREQGELLRGEADYQLHLVYLWYEHNTPEALDLLESLDRRYGSNPLFLARIGEVQDVYVHDHPASAAVWRELLDRVHRGQVNEAPLAAARAHLGLARELDAMFETDRAVEELEAALQADPPPPFDAQAQLQLGAARDRVGERDLAMRAYNAAISLASASDADAAQIREKARAGLRQAPDARSAEAYRTSLEGWRALERGDSEEAVALLARATESAPADPVMRYRYAHALDAIGEHERAQSELEKVIAARAVPAIVLASAYVDYASALEHAGDRQRALTYYRDATEMVGAEPHARDRAARAIKRLTKASSRGANFFDFSRSSCLTSRFSHP